MTLKRYPSDLSLARWKLLREIIPLAKPGGRPRSVQLREVINGILFIVDGGHPWRRMPDDLPPWSTCYDYYRKWRRDGTWQRIDAVLQGARSSSSGEAKDQRAHGETRRRRRGEDRVVRRPRRESVREG